MHLTPEDRLFKLRALTLLCGMGYRRSNALRGGRRTFIWGGTRDEGQGKHARLLRGNCWCPAAIRGAKTRTWCRPCARRN